MHKAIYAGLVRACHDLSEGGLAVAAAEMAFAGGFGAKIDLKSLPSPFGRGAGGEGVSGWENDPTVLLFSESNTRFICEVTPENAAAFEKAMSGIACAKIGEVIDSSTLEITLDQPILKADIAALKESWQKPLRW